MTMTSTGPVRLGRLIGDLDEAYARMRQMVPALGAGPVDTALLSEEQRDCIRRHDILAEQVRAARATRGPFPSQAHQG